MQTKVIIRQPRKGKENEDIMWTSKKKSIRLEHIQNCEGWSLGKII